jgi:GNAT superfamily N-acetyltransferase
MGFELAVANAATHWTSMADARGWAAVVRPGFTAVRAEEGHRVLLTAPPKDPEALTAELAALFRGWQTSQLCLEDPYLALDLTECGCEAALTMPVMVRDPLPGGAGDPGQAPVEAGRQQGRIQGRHSDRPGPGVTVAEAVTEPELAAVEQVVVEGFPIVHRLPWRRGEQFPAVYAFVPGRRSWLARVDGRPAAACVTLDDGVAVGFYWVATLPEHRSRGAARAVMCAALAAHAGRVATLTATLLGEPLYRRLGFTERGLSRWWRYPATPDELRR